MHFGLWNYQTWTQLSYGSVIFEGCHSIPEFVEVDPQWKAARAFSILALVMGVGIMMAELFLICNKYKEVEDLRISPLLGGGFLACSLFSGMSLLLLGSDLCKGNQLSDEFMNLFPNIKMSISGCVIATGAKCTISATILYFVAAAAALRAYKIGVDDEKNIKDSNTVASIEPLLMGYDEFNTVSTKWLHGRH